LHSPTRLHHVGAVVAVVGLAAEVYICRQMTQQTGGTYTGEPGY
jgi:hypothetical protein